MPRISLVNLVLVCRGRRGKEGEGGGRRGKEGEG